MTCEFNIKQTPKSQYIKSNGMSFWPPFFKDWEFEKSLEWLRKTLGHDGDNVRVDWNSQGLDFFVYVDGDPEKLWTDKGLRDYLFEKSEGHLTIRDLEIKTIYEVEVTDEEGRRYY